MGTFYFFWQKKGGEDAWQLALSPERQEIVQREQPAFSTVLDLSVVPDDGDWSKTRYRGPFYADFDAGDDLPLVCEQFIAFLLKLEDELKFDLSQALLFASGSKGFHIEIPQECFIPKPPVQGTLWLPYVYREVAQSLMVDTLDLQVYTGKRGRMWRTTNVKRDNGNYKVPLTVDEALSMTPDVYRQIIKAPREVPAPTPASCNSAFAMLFERSRDKMVSTMRGRKKRMDQANRLLDPWKKAKKNPPTIEMLMAGQNIKADVGFQHIAMQLAIYASSVGMPAEEFVERCKGLCENHVSDSFRYNTVAKRREELLRMLNYMEQNTLYEFDTAPLIRMVTPGTDMPDLGQMATEDHEDQAAQPAAETSDPEDGDSPATTEAQHPAIDLHKTVRRGFFMNADGMWRNNGQSTDTICRATLRNVTAFYDVERSEFRGYEFDIVVKGRKTNRTMLGADAFTSINTLRKFFAAHQLSFQGSDADASALLDIMAEKALRSGRIYTYPREGFFVIDHPETDQPEMVKVYLTQDQYLSSIAEDDQTYFRLRYRPMDSLSAYCIDIHRAPELCDKHIDDLHRLFGMNHPDVISKVVGWFVAAHYRSLYLHLFRQFPMLQVYGGAGEGKTKTIEVVARMHWYRVDLPIKSAMSFSPWAMDAIASSSTSAPLIIDEYKPRELRSVKGKYEKLKDIMKANYVGSEISNKGFLNKGAAESQIGMVRARATAPLVFIGESVEMETAIIERCVTVQVNKNYLTDTRSANHAHLLSNWEAVSALGRRIIEMGFALNMDSMRTEMREIMASIESKQPARDDRSRRRISDRAIYNRAVIVHALRTLQRILQKQFGSEFDADLDMLLGVRADESADEKRITEIHAMSEISKVVNRLALLSRDIDQPYELRNGRDYVVGDGWVEIKVEKSYDAYRRYCAMMNDTPLFDNLDSFGHALNGYSPVTDRVCITSELRDDDSGERIVRMDSKLLAREGVQPFRN